MKTKININGKEVEIELTTEQVNFIKSKSIDYTDIKTLQNALDYNGKTLKQFNWETERDTDQQKATKELEEIAKALRLGNELTMTDTWYYPYFRRNSVSGFSFNDYDCDRAYSIVSSRLCVENSDKAIYMGKQFIEIYNRHLAPEQK
ncbi:hypothetical protein [Pedobacter sp.]